MNTSIQVTQISKEEMNVLLSDLQSNHKRIYEMKQTPLRINGVDRWAENTGNTFRIFDRKTGSRVMIVTTLLAAMKCI